MADLVYMAKSAWTALLDSIRAKGGTEDLLTAAQAKAAVDAIETGGGAPTYGLIAEYTVSEPVAQIRISLPELVIEDGHVWVELVGLGHANDYLYPMINDLALGGKPYFARTTEDNRAFRVDFYANKTVAGTTFLGGYAVTGASVGTAAVGGLVPTDIYLKLYNSSNTFTGGTVRIYGRVT